MKTKFTLGWLLLITLLFSSAVYCQCPSSISASATVSPAACPSSGSAVINTTPAATSSFVFKLTAGPSGATLNAPQSSNTFSALPAGNYTASVTCGSASATVAFTIANTYTPITSVGAAVTTNCGTFAQSAQVTISAVGGTAPLSYSIVQSNDPNYPDAQSVYTSSPIKTLNAYSTYQVRVKDACNQFFTKTVTVTAPFPPVQVQAWGFTKSTCAGTKMNVKLGLYDPVTQTYPDFTPYFNDGGIKIRLWEQDPGGTCAPSGPILLDTIVNNWDTVHNVTIPASKKYYVQTITPCGDTSSYCADLNWPLTPAMFIEVITSGCVGSSSNPPVMLLNTKPFQFMSYPITAVVKNSAGATVFTKVLHSDAETLNAGNLPMDDYTLTFTDACGTVVTETVYNPAGSGPANFAFTWYSSSGCTARPGPGTTQSGTTSGFLSGWGYLPDLANSDFTIISGPSNVGVKGFYDGWGNIIWDNLLPGNYVIRVTTVCGVTDYPVTVAPATPDIFVHTITAAAASSCGGSGTITSTIVSTADNPSDFNLIDAATGNIVATNLTGNFNNIAPGNYYVQMTTPDCNWNYYNTNSNTVTISSGAGPQIAKKMGMACEDASGTPLSTGSAYLSVAGAAPLTVEYKLASAGTWTVWSTSAPNDFSIGGLQAGSLYDIRITSCGITTATQVTIERVGHISRVTQVQPCDMSAYSLDLPQMAGASYTWTRLPGTLVSSVYNYSIANYNSSYNGSYAGTLTWSGCLLRTDTVSLNSLFCGGGLLPVNLLSFTGKQVGKSNIISWKVSGEEEATTFTVERSGDAKHFSSLGTIGASQNNSYNFTDESPLNPNNYYRLKITDDKGAIKYSNSIGISNSLSEKLSIYPSITTGPVTISGIKPGMLVRVSDAAGRTVQSSAATGSQIVLDLGKCAKGFYQIIISGDNQTIRTSSIVKE